MSRGPTEPDTRPRRRRLPDDFERAHHVVLLVLEDVAVPDVLRVVDAGRQLDRALVGQLEPGSDAGDVPGVGLNRVLATVLVRGGWHGGARVGDRLRLRVVGG